MANPIISHADFVGGALLSLGALFGYRGKEEEERIGKEGKRQSQEKRLRRKKIKGQNSNLEATVIFVQK